MARVLPESAQALLAGASVEMDCTDVAVLDAAARLLPPGTDVFIALPPQGSWDGLLAAARAVHAAGLNPVPNMPARKVADRAHLARLAGALARSAGVTRVLLLAGAGEQEGEYASTLPVLESGVLPAHGITSICVAGHPEGHPLMDGTQLARFEQRKAQLARAQDFELTFVTPLCFDAEPILAWERRLRACGITAAVRAGMPGPLPVATLRQVVQLQGAGPSARQLDGCGDSGRFDPARLLVPLGAAVAAGTARLQAHLFSLGALDDTCRWINLGGTTA